MSLKEVGALLRVSVPTVRNMIVAGKLKAINLSGAGKRGLFRVRKCDYSAAFEKGFEGEGK